MANKVGMTVRVISNRLPDMAAGMADRAQAIIDRTAYRIEARAKATVVYKTGTLRRSIHTLTPTTAGLVNPAPAGVSVPLGHLPKKGQAFVGVGVYYGKFIEFGTSKMGPRPFLIPALEAEAPRFRAEIDELVK